MNIMDEIKSKGYWSIKLHPAEYDEYFDINKLKDIISNISVDIRGWDYPHVSTKDLKKISQEKINCFCNWPERGKIEYWEFSTNGLFEHIFAMSEDYISESKKKELKNRFHFGQETVEDKNKLLEVLNTIYEITEIFIFASRYAQLNVFDKANSFVLIIELHDVNNRFLYIWDQLRNLWSPYICSYIDSIITLGGVYEKNELIGEYEALSFNSIKEVFQAFNWDNMNEQMIRDEQRKLLERRF